MKYLVIAEKPSVSKSIAKVIGAYRQEDGYLEGGDCVVSWCLGHLAEYAAPEHYDERYENWRFEDLPILPVEWKLLVHNTKKPQFNVLRKLLRSKKFDYVVNACDAGREGEAIFRRVYALAGSNLPIKRLWISSMEDAAIQQGFENLKDGAAYDNLFAASECRAKADWLIGMNGTRAFTKKYGRKQTIGRVQTPTLAMLAERQTKIQNFVKEPYYKVELSGAGVLAASEQMVQEQDADAMQAACDGQCAVVGSIERKRVEKKPPKLYNLTTLQREANRYYSLTASQTLQALQELYEEKLVTYPRTDSQFVTEDMRKTVESLVLALDGAAADVSCVINNSKVTDHHALLPTMQGAKCNKEKLSETKQKILSLIIWKLVQAVQPPFIYEDVLGTVCCQGQNFTAKYKDVLQPGYTAKPVPLVEPEKNKDASLPNDLEQGMVIPVVRAEKKQGFTSPPKVYTEDTLLSAMETAGNKEFEKDTEKKGLGTPATRAAILEKLVSSGYVQRKGKQMIPTEDGVAAIRNIPDYLKSSSMTAEWENDLLRMERGEIKPYDFMQGIYNFMVEKTPEEYTEFVKNEYGTGGKGFEIDGAKYAVWFDDLGLRIAAGSTAKGGTIVNAFLSWEDVSNRIHELLRQGEYAPQAVLDAARQNALQEYAQTLAYMERDLADGVAEAVFQDVEIFRGGFPELTDRLAGLLDDTDFLTDLNERLSALGEAYVEDKDLMRMHFYKPDKVAALFQQFAKPYQNYAARESFHWNEHKKFITEDEINAYFTRGSNYSDSRLAIYSFFLNHEDKKVRADFLKDHYGIGGSSHALCGADDSHEDHDGRGIALERGSYGNPYASVHLNWNQAAGRIDQLIRDSEYLKPADYSRMPVYEREWMAMRVMGFYHHLPNEVERPYPQDLYHEEGRKALVEKLADPEQAAELLEQMDTALLSVPMDSEEYERKAESLSILHQYVEGTYTIFPEKKRAVEIAVPEQGQMSMFDFMEQEPQSKEQSIVATVEKPRKEKVVARYQSTVMMQAGYIEDIAILQYPDGKFYNHYNYDEETGTGAAETGPFNSLNDAKAVIRQTREDAKAVESFENQPKQMYSRENGSFLYLGNNHLYRIERSNAHDVYLKDMENSAVAGRVIPLPSYSETLAKNPLNLSLIHI